MYVLLKHAIIQGVPLIMFHFIFCNLGVQNDPLMGPKVLKVVGLCISFHLVYCLCDSDP